METNNFNLKNGVGGRLSLEIDSCDTPKVSAVLCDKTVTADVGGDFVIPEQNPELQRLLRVEARPSAPSKFMSGSGVQISGGIEYTALYVASDGEVYSVTFPGEYSMSVPFNDGADRTADGISAFARVVPESAVSRVGGGGHINIKCRLSVKVLVLGSVSPDVGTAGEWGGGIQRLLKKRTVACELRGSKDDAELISSVDTRKGEIRYLASDCSVFVTDTACGDGYVDCRGYASVKHLLCKNGELCSVSERIPFSETVELDGAESGMSAFVSGSCSDIVRRNDGAGLDLADGDGVVDLTIRLCLDAVVLKTGVLEYVRDAYSVDRELKLETEKLRFPTPLICKNGNMTFSGRAPLADAGIPDGALVADAWGSARIESVTWSKEGAMALGKCRFGMICLADGGEIVLSECELPFKYEFEGGEGEIERMDNCVSVIDPRITVDGGEIVADCELAIGICALGEGKVEAVTSVSEGAEDAEKRSGFTVCYPDSSDSLWSVAKRYRTPVSKTASENGLEGVGDADETYLPAGKKYMIV